MSAIRELHRKDSIFFPLSEFYQELRLPLPRIRRVEPSEVPEPERSLLVHDRDMTPTLEAAHGGKLHLQVLKYARLDGAVKRLVVLALDDGDETAVGMGAIHIFLEPLPPAARKPVLELHEPFGAILQRNGVTHSSLPSAYFEVMPDSMITSALRMRNPRSLYGRRNTILNSSGEVLAEVLEILPPSRNT